MRRTTPASSSAKPTSGDLCSLGDFMTKAHRTAFAFVFISGLMLGACAVQLKDELSLHYGTLGFDQIARCLSMGP